MALTEKVAKTQEVVSLTLEPMVMGRNFFGLVCDVRGRVLDTIAAIHDWNSLPESVIFSVQINLFKSVDDQERFGNPPVSPPDSR